MKLYHGSNQVVREIDLSKSHPNKDFGRAFYLSEEYAQAEDMAKFKVVIEGGNPVVNEFHFDEELLNGDDLHICRFEGYSTEWADFVFANRDADNKAVHNYDIVYGPIANDRVGRQITNLKEGYISFEEFLNRLKYMKGITFQYAFCTEKAISELQVI